jgi:4-amino-4-deoxy-L-arabinose transferase-like glycosyltransferase
MSVQTAKIPFRERMKSVSRHPVFLLCLVLIGYSALLLPTVGRQGISWDEQTDIDIARSYISRPDGWFRGSESDPSQTRLPMYLVAMVYALLKTDDLFTARLVSCFVGALTIVGVYVYCKRNYDHKRGALACSVLATSPFFLSFARTAFTETDIFVACAFSWLMVCMSVLQEKGTVGWAAAVAVFFGLAIAAKFTAVVVFPAILFYVLSFPRENPGGERLSRRDMLGGAALLTVMAASILFGWAGINSTAPFWREGWLLKFHGYLALLGWILVLVWATRHRDRVVQPLILACFVIALSLGTFMVLPPVHTTNPRIIASLVWRFDNQVEWNPAFTKEAAILHLASVIFKSSPLMGAGLLIGLVAAWFQWKGKKEARFPLLVVLFYFLGLVLLPIAQTFYMVPLLPIMAILGSDQWLTLWSKKRTWAAFVGTAAAVLLVVDLFLCYPDYNLNGYQWLGGRYLGGRPTIGYRSVIQTTSDGVQQIVQWVCDNATRGGRVVAYVYPWHIVEATCPDPRFRISRGRWASVRSRPDFVIIHINHQVRASWAAYFTGWESNAPAEDVFWEPYDADWLHTHFTKVATVPRAFGLEMASVWQRNERDGE